MESVAQTYDFSFRFQFTLTFIWDQYLFKSVADKKMAKPCEDFFSSFNKDTLFLGQSCTRSGCFKSLCLGYQIKIMNKSNMYTFFLYPLNLFQNILQKTRDLGHAIQFLFKQISTIKFDRTIKFEVFYIMYVFMMIFLFCQFQLHRKKHFLCLWSPRSPLFWSFDLTHEILMNNYFCASTKHTPKHN